MFDPTNPDPLGIGIQARAADQRFRFNEAGRQNAASHGQLVNFGLPSLPMSPSWEGFFQAMKENSSGKLAMENPQGLPESEAGLSGPATGQDNSGAFGMPGSISGSMLQGQTPLPASMQSLLQRARTQPQPRTR